ncbi:MAG TPA: hypothetical protein VG013_14280 [Gemmataceae bacterium]|jgi:hypothetical protein|nr:hypothetical protein [Gemmataceae bacterium]
MAMHLPAIDLDLDINPVDCAVAGTVSFALIGFLFGAVTRLVGKRGGGRLGTAVAEALGPLPEDMHRAVAGGVDGAVFLGAVGLVASVLAGPGAFLYVLGLVLLLVLGAAFFGGLAHNLTGRRSRPVTAFCGAVLGAVVGLMVTNGSAYGAVTGTLAGLLPAAFAHPRPGGEPPTEDPQK